MKGVKYIVTIYIHAQSGCATTPKIGTGRVCLWMLLMLTMRVPAVRLRGLLLRFLMSVPTVRRLILMSVPAVPCLLSSFHPMEGVLVLSVRLDGSRH